MNKPPVKPTTFRKPPVTISAIQLTPETVRECLVFLQEGSVNAYLEFGESATLIIPTLEGDMTASPGDWIIRGVDGEFYPCKPDIFRRTYEPVEEG